MRSGQALGLAGAGAGLDQQVDVEPRADQVARGLIGRGPRPTHARCSLRYASRAVVVGRCRSSRSARPAASLAAGPGEVAEPAILVLVRRVDEGARGEQVEEVAQHLRRLRLGGRRAHLALAPAARW